MRRYGLLPVYLAALVMLAGCTTLPMGQGASTGWANAAIEIAKDPACGHTDILDVMLGPIPSGHIHLERSNCKPATWGASPSP